MTPGGLQDGFNTYDNGASRTIKAHYGQTSAANSMRKDGLGASGVIESIPPHPIPIANKYPRRPDGRIPYDTRAWVYDPGGIAPTLNASDYKDPRLIIEQGNKQKTDNDNVIAD